jgi:hypothetical protein
MKSKKESAYERCFNEIKKYINKIPKNIIIDYEKGLFNALKTTFPLSNFTGCLFHYGQAVWRKLCSLGLNYYYNNDQKFRKRIRMLINLVFVPKNCITIELNKIISVFENEHESCEKLKEFISYFLNNYLGRCDENGKYIDSLFGLDFWSVYENVKNELPRSTCSVEAWHRSLNAIFGIAHPNFGRFIEAIQAEEESCRIKIMQCTAGKLCISDKNLKKEELLSVVIKNYVHFEGFGFFEALDSIYEWKFET